MGSEMCIRDRVRARATPAARARTFLRTSSPRAAARRNAPAARRAASASTNADIPDTLIRAKDEKFTLPQDGGIRMACTHTHGDWKAMQLARVEDEINETSAHASRDSTPSALFQLLSTRLQTKLTRAIAEQSTKTAAQAHLCAPLTR